MRREILDKAFRDNISPFEWMHQNLDGELIPCEVTLVRTFYKGNDAMLVYSRDLRQFKKTEQVANDANERMRIMFDTMPFTASFINKDFDIVDCNQAAIDIYELTSKQEYFDRFYDLMPEYQPDGKLSKEAAFEAISKAFKEGYNHFEFINQKLNGEIIPEEVSLFRIDYKGEDTIMGYARDMRDVKAALKEVEKATDRINLMKDSIAEMNKVVTVMSNLDSMVTVTDLDHNLIYINKSLADTFEVDIENYIGEKCYKYLRNLDSPCDFCFLSKLTPDKDSLPVMDYEFIYDHSKNIWMSGKTAIIRWVDGSMAYLHSAKDTTEIKKNQEQLNEALEAAKAASLDKSSFLANMSHEIRTPMNAVLGMTELLLHEKLSKRQIKYAEDIRTSTMALLNILNDILDVSKLEAGKLTLMPVHYNFNTFIDNISSIAYFLCEAKNITFKLIMKEQAHACLYGDDLRLRQVLLNLLDNAVKFTEKGNVQLAINYTETAIKFTVSDTGTGIPAENIPTLFEAFEQADVLLHRATKGTGLGLTITKSIVELMGGSISVESVYGQGASFSVEIPKILGDMALINQIGDKGRIINAPDAKILVVDDNLTNLSVACGLLRIFQIEAETATSGKEAIELVQRNQYDIVFMDHRMPDMSGVETVKEIRKLGVNVPIVALTASVLASSKVMMQEAGMNDFLSKPIIKSELMHILSTWLPDEKLIDSVPDAVTTDKIEAEADKEFWEIIEQIEGLSISTGLDRVDGQRNNYKKTLRLMIQEIEKSKVNLPAFLSADDLDNFSIEVHSIRGALANIGAMKLSEKAYALEIASGKSDTGFCFANLPTLLEGLDVLYSKLNEAFSKEMQSNEPITMPPELPGIFAKVISAFSEVDLTSINNEIENIDALNLSDNLKAEIERIKDMVLLMDYDRATEHIRRLLNNA